MTTEAVDPSLLDRLVELFRRRYGRPDGLQVVRAPYRVCPIGAHIDHQGGTVLGMAIDRGVTFLWRRRHDPIVRLVSTAFPEEISFSLAHLPEPRGQGFWGDYAAGAAFALLKGGRALERGLDGVLGGELPVGGLSSSAAVGLAYGVALRRANDIEIEQWDVVRGAVTAENGYVGVSCGLLDPTTIFCAQPGSLVEINCRDERAAVVPPGPSMAPHVVGVVFSGVPRALARSGYNNRVAECHEAARRLGEMCGRADAHRLGEIPREEFERLKDRLSEALRGRAEHYFTENERVAEGLRAWRDGDLARFGRLVTASGASSVNNYQAGCPEIIHLWEGLARTPGVHGTRFSGGGFGGAVIALVDPAAAEAVEAEVSRGYVERFPRCASGFRFEFRTSGPGLTWGEAP